MLPEALEADAIEVISAGFAGVGVAGSCSLKFALSLFRLSMTAVAAPACERVLQKPRSLLDYILAKHRPYTKRRF